MFAPGASDQLRILGYLYSRPELHLVPQRLWSSEGFYSYPVLEAMLGTQQLVATRLLALGLATSAIAIAVNDIAAMVTGLPSRQ